MSSKVVSHIVHGRSMSNIGPVEEPRNIRGRAKSSVSLPSLNEPRVGRLMWNWKKTRRIVTSGCRRKLWRRIFWDLRFYAKTPSLWKPLLHVFCLSFSWNVGFSCSLVFSVLLEKRLCWFLAEIARSAVGWILEWGIPVERQCFLNDGYQTCIPESVTQRLL